MRHAGGETVLLLGEPEGAIVEAVAGLADGALAGPVAAATLRPDRYHGDLIRDLDALPFSAWDAVPWQSYNMVSLLSSRGCGAGCRYCGYAVAQGSSTRRQSISRTLAEWTWLAREIRPPYLTLRDPVFAHDRERVAALCEGILAAKMQIPWACESRPEHFDRDLLRLMQAAGCVMVKIGLESGDPDLLAQIGRVAARAQAVAYLEQTREVAAACADLDIPCQVFVMAGLPGETGRSVALTEAALRRLAPSAVIRAKPYHADPGTALPVPAGGAHAVLGAVGGC